MEGAAAGRGGAERRARGGLRRAGRGGAERGARGGPRGAGRT
jgi:hypothetical protein